VRWHLVFELRVLGVHGTGNQWEAWMTIDGRCGMALVLAAILSGLLPAEAETLLRTWGGNGAADGRFLSPGAIAVDGGRVYVVEQGNNRVQVFDVNGKFLRKWGSAGSGDGQFNSPSGLTVEDGQVYVTDGLNNRVQVFDVNGAFLRKWGSAGLGDGQFAFPIGIAIQQGQAYVADSTNNRVQVFDLNGRFQRKWTWRPLFPPDPPFFASPHFIALAGHEIYVTGGTSVIGGDERLRVFDRDGTFLRSWISRLQSALGVAVRGNQVYVASGNSVLVFDRQGTPLRSFGSFGSADGQFLMAIGVAVQDEEVYVLDSSRVQVFAPDKK
jgi:DNA-binding beta-propeller fold protein YncE